MKKIILRVINSSLALREKTLKNGHTRERGKLIISSVSETTQCFSVFKKKH